MDFAYNPLCRGTEYGCDNIVLSCFYLLDKSWEGVVMVDFLLSHFTSSHDWVNINHCKIALYIGVIYLTADFQKWLLNLAMH